MLLTFKCAFPIFVNLRSTSAWFFQGSDDVSVGHWCQGADWCWKNITAFWKDFRESPTALHGYWAYYMDKSISANRRQIIRQKLKKQTYEVVESCGWEPFLSKVFFCRKTWIHLFWQVSWSQSIAVNGCGDPWLSVGKVSPLNPCELRHPPQQRIRRQVCNCSFFFAKTFSNNDGTKLIFQGTKSIIPFEAVVRGGASGSFPSPSGVAE